MQEGTVKFFNQNKSYGFIAGDDGKDYFVHTSGIVPGIYIKDGDKVSFANGCKKKNTKFQALS